MTLQFRVGRWLDQTWNRCRVERSEERWWCAELHRLRGVFLATIDADETQIEASFCAAISTAKQQKSTSLAMRAEAFHAEYRSRKARAHEYVVELQEWLQREGLTYPAMPMEGGMPNYFTISVFPLLRITIPRRLMN